MTSTRGKLQNISHDRVSGRSVCRVIPLCFKVTSNTESGLRSSYVTDKHNHLFLCFSFLFFFHLKYFWIINKKPVYLLSKKHLNLSHNLESQSRRPLPWMLMGTLMFSSRLAGEHEAFRHQA